MSDFANDQKKKGDKFVEDQREQAEKNAKAAEKVAETLKDN